MSYFKPFVDSAGLHIPAYQDIVDELVADAQNIYGSDIYLGADSPDYQYISAVASMIYDSFLTSQTVYNGRGPGTATGSNLDVIVGLNGIKRLGAVYSTCTVVLGGVAGTTISGGIVQDVNGNEWSVASPSIIGSGGTVTALTTCQTAGAIVANIGDINTIVTPQLGWTSVTNQVAATVGAPAEVDSALRARQAISTAQPSQSILEGLKGALAAVSGVTRFKVYENDTGSADSNGLPAHSVTCVVEGGASTDIGNAIYSRKGPGCATNGTSSVTVTDSYGVASTINYDVVQYTQIDVDITVKKLSGYGNTTGASIQSALVSYLNSLPIGGPYVYISGLWSAALSVNPIPTNPIFSIVSLTAATHGGTQGTSDIPIAYNYAAQGVTANITVTEE